jgi:hypothetical protein
MEYTLFLFECETNINETSKALNKVIFNEKNKLGTDLHRNLCKILIADDLLKNIEAGEKRMKENIDKYQDYIQCNIAHDSLISEVMNNYIKYYQTQIEDIINMTRRRNDRMNEYYDLILLSKDISFDMIKTFNDNMENEKKLLLADRQRITKIVDKLKDELRNKFKILYLMDHYSEIIKILKLTIS